jgi:hypothetical protein
MFFLTKWFLTKKLVKWKLLIKWLTTKVLINSLVFDKLIFDEVSYPPVSGNKFFLTFFFFFFYKVVQFAAEKFEKGFKRILISPSIFSPEIWPNNILEEGRKKNFMEEEWWSLKTLKSFLNLEIIFSLKISLLWNFFYVFNIFAAKWKVFEMLLKLF